MRYLDKTFSSFEGVTYCCQQASTLIDRHSMSEIAIFHHLKNEEPLKSGLSVSLDDSCISVIRGAATVAFTVIATRWLYRAGTAQRPAVRGGSNVHEIKTQWRALGLGGGLFFVVLFMWSWRDLRHPDWVFLAMAVIFTVSGVWLASGSVRTDQAGITKRVLWQSNSFRWDEITQISVLKKRGDAIELYAGARKLIIDLRFVALSHLLAEIERQTSLTPLARD